MDPRTSEIVLTQPLDVTALDVGKLAATLEIFVKYLAFWTGYLPSMPTGAPRGAASASGHDPMIRA
jgi:hypothetical protein